MTIPSWKKLLPETIDAVLWRLYAGIGDYLFEKLRKLILSRKPSRRVWGFDDAPNIIVATQYTEDDRLLAGFGDSQAVLTILRDLRHMFPGVENNVCPSTEIAQTGEDGRVDARLMSNLLLVGGPDTNDITRRVMCEMLHPGYMFQPDGCIYDNLSKEIVEPPKQGHYCLIMKAHNPFAREYPRKILFILAGAHTQGTAVAGSAMRNESVIKEILFRRGDKDFEMIVDGQLMNSFTPTNLNVTRTPRPFGGLQIGIP